MKVYLSGPMTGYESENRPAFHAAAAALRECGFDVVNPAELNPGPPPSERDLHAYEAFYNACMRVDIKALCDCEAIALMPGWERSKGAHLELHIAHRVGLQVWQVGELLGMRVGAA